MGLDSSHFAERYAPKVQGRRLVIEADKWKDGPPTSRGVQARLNDCVCRDGGIRADPVPVKINCCRRPRMRATQYPQHAAQMVAVAAALLHGGGP